MTASRRNRLIRIERNEVTEDAFGGEIFTWGFLTKEWAQVIFAKGSERREAAQERASAAATFIILANPVTNGISAQHRIVFDGSNWDITSNIPSRQFNAEREIEAVRAVK